MSAELAARRTAAAAALADYRRDRADDFSYAPARYWATRLAIELESVLVGIEADDRDRDFEQLRSARG